METEIYCKTIKKTSQLVEQIRGEFRAWNEAEPDFDEGFLDDDMVESYLAYLVDYVHKDDWYVIEDRPEVLARREKNEGTISDNPE